MFAESFSIGNSYLIVQIDPIHIRIAQGKTGVRGECSNFPQLIRTNQTRLGGMRMTIIYREDVYESNGKLIFDAGSLTV